MWWAIVTLATLGYGDIVPITPLGKFLGGIAAILGFGMFALPAGILANGFAEEIKRLRDVSSWNMVVQVPLFASLDAGIINEIAGLLRVKRFIKNEVIVKEGDKGDAMYFIVEGEVRVSSGNWGTILGEGDFFGEIALVKDLPRTATVRALNRCETLKLSTYDFKKTLANRLELLEQIERIADERMVKK
jgi:voltage-gated potassium channel